MRCLLFVLALLALGAFAQNCTTVTCVQVTDACFVTPQNNEIHLCENSHCDIGGSDTCVPVADFGAACGSAASDAACVGAASKYYSTWNTACLSNNLCGAGNAFQAPSGPGDNCSFTEPLLGDVSRGGCFQGSNCTTGGWCDFADEGQTCSQNCKGGLHCKFTGAALECVPLGKEGDACSFTDPCISGLFCGDAAVCAPLFSLAEGDTCTTTNVAPVGRIDGSFFALSVTSECGAGLGCVGGTCATIDNSNVGKDCENVTDCGDGYACVESNSCENPGKFCALTAYPVDAELSTLWATFQNCLATNNCSYGPFQTQLPFHGQEFDNCAQRLCFAEWTAYVDAWYPSTAYTECSTAPATTTGGPTGGPTGPTAGPTTAGGPTAGPTAGPTVQQTTTRSATVTRTGATRAATSTTDGAATVVASLLVIVIALALLL